jgi:hypothetical protein
LVLALAVAQTALGDTARVATIQGNRLYARENFNEAINKYDEALVANPEALRPRFNKANSYYRLDDLSQAMDLYREVAAESKDMGLVAKAKYNLGNSYFQQGMKQRDSDLQKAIDDLKTAIGSWRGTLDIEPRNKKAAKNIEVARLTIKDIMDQLKNQQQDPNQPQDPNQSQQQQQQDQQQQGSQQDPNQPQGQQQQDQGSGQDPNEPQDPNQPEEKQEQPAPDATAQEILDREQRQRQSRHVLVAAIVTPASGQVRVSAQVDTDKDIYAGDNFGFYIIIANSDKPGQVDLEPLRQYNPRSTGTRTHSSTDMVRGTTVRAMIMTYALTASQVGSITLPSLKVVVDGKTYRTNPVSVNIVKPGTTDRLDIEMTLSEKQCFAGQPVLLTIDFYYSVADIKNTQFNIPVLASDAFHFENPDVGNQQAKEYDLGTGATVLVSQRNVVHKNRQSAMVRLRKILIPKNAGKIQIAPAVVSTDVAVGRVRSRGTFDSFFGSQVKYQRFMVKSDPLELTVLPLPNEGKPAQFYGLVGRFTIQASATPTQVSVGDPITLTVRIGGGTYLKPVRWPALEQVPNLAANFKIPGQKASPTVSGGFKVFTQTIRANNENVTEIPSITLAYFDAETGKYETVRTEPIKLDVAPTKILTNADLEGADFTPVNREVEAIKKGLSANYEDLDVLKDMSFSPLAALTNPGYAVLWAVPLLTFISSVLVKLFIHTSPEKVAIRRRRQACGKAIGQLKRMASADSDRQGELLVSIMKQYIGDRFDKTAGSLTPDDCYDAIVTESTDKQAADKYRDTIADFEAGRYASIEVNITGERIEQAIQLVRTVEKNCRR